MPSPRKPSPAVLAAFGAASAEPELLAGGRGSTWRAGAVVLRPAGDLAESRWKAEVLAALAHDDGFRAHRPVAASGADGSVDGDWVVDDWEAWQWVPGAADETRVGDVISAGAAFHAALVELPRPAFLDHSTDAWSVADRMSWGEVPLPRHPQLDRLAAAFAPVAAPSQLIHGDLLGNVLFAPDAAPTIIDWAPYWRPAGLGAAVAAVDAVCWHGYPLDGLDALGEGVADWRRLLVRAMVFRIATLHLLDAWNGAMERLHEPVVVALTRDAGSPPARP